MGSTTSEFSLEQYSHLDGCFGDDDDHDFVKITTKKTVSFATEFEKIKSELDRHVSKLEEALDVSNKRMEESKEEEIFQVKDGSFLFKIDKKCLVFPAAIALFFVACALAVLVCTVTTVFGALKLNKVAVSNLEKTFTSNSRLIFDLMEEQSQTHASEMQKMKEQNEQDLAATAHTLRKKEARILRLEKKLALKKIFDKVCRASSELRPRQFKPFESTQELRNALDDYLGDDNHRASVVEIVYGEHVGCWDVSKISDLGHLF